jgi:hypothetical protein
MSPRTVLSLLLALASAAIVQNSSKSKSQVYVSSHFSLWEI